MTPLWQIRMLGEFAVVTTSAAVHHDVRDFRWQKAAALLARLAVLPGERHSRESLIALLWPDAEWEKGQVNLRSAIASLRRQIEPPGIEPGSVLRAHGRTHLSLNPDTVTTDVQIFEAAMRERRWADAVAAFTGTFLPAFYDDWVIEEQNRLNALVEEARSQLSSSPSARTRGTEPAPSPAATSEPASPSPTRALLPIRMTRFFGREAESALLRQMREDGRRWITITGPGGSGKTRFAIEAADEASHSDRYSFVGFVPLADLTAASEIPGRIAGVLDRQANRVEDRESLVSLLNQLTDGAILLVLDNFEHLAGQEAAVLLVHDLLTTLPHLTLIVTSRQRLGGDGERELPLLPLDTPQFAATPERLLDFPSVRLFLDRAQAVRPDFQLTPRNAGDIGSLVTQLEGVPLALELAASWAQTLSPARMKEQFGDVVRVQRAGKRKERTRHDSLAATLMGSLALLTRQMRALLLRLTVFRGGFTADAAAEIGDEPDADLLLTQLRERSLLYTEEVGQTIRFRMLESLRDLLLEIRDEAETGDLERRHFDWFVAFLDRTIPLLHGVEQGQWLELVEAEYPNIRLALDFCYRDDAWPALDEAVRKAFHITTRASHFWDKRGRYAEGKECLTRALSRTGAESPTKERATALNCLGVMNRMLGDFRAALACYEQSLAVQLAIEDKSGQAITLGNIAVIFALQGDYSPARKHIDESIQILRELNDVNALGRNLNILGAITMEQEDYEAARRTYEESLMLCRASGNLENIGLVLNNLANVLYELREWNRQREVHEEALAVFRQGGIQHGIALVLANCTYSALQRWDFEEAKALLEEGLALSLQINNIQTLILFAHNFARYAALLGDRPTSVRIFSGVFSHSEQVGYSGAAQNQQANAALLETLRHELGDAIYTRLWNEGSALSWSETLSLCKTLLERNAAPTTIAAGPL